MEEVIIPILFVAIAINIPVTIAYLIGLQFQINKPNCKQDVNDVKRNILMTKIVQLFNLLIYIALFIFMYI